MVDEGVGVDHGAAADVHDERSVGQGRQRGVVDEVSRRVAAGKRHDQHVGRGEHVEQLAEGEDLDVVLPAPVRSDRAQIDLEGLQPRRDGTADTAEASRVTRASARPGVHSPFHSARSLRAHEVGQRTLGRERQGDGELGGRRLVHARGVGEHGALGQAALDVVVADRLPLHEPGRHLGQPRDDVVHRHVGRHHDVDVRAGRGIVMSQTSTSTPSGRGCRSSRSWAVGTDTISEEVTRPTLPRVRRPRPPQR